MPSPPSKTKKRRSSLGAAAISLTSMMDMLTIILLFLLKSFASEGQALTSDARLKLPVSSAVQAPKQTLIVQVNNEDIIVDGVKVADAKQSLVEKNLLIKPLLDELNRQAKKTEYIASKNPNVRFTGEILIQGDRQIPFVLLEKLMFTCGQAGYNGISLAVTSLE
ncbi:MAG: biopolymer transporter ExbD [Deltaproteobacteria bacterium]|nr:biopolymer transporter ExbD [Deltaproteobacteria bacterium]